jgi:predicted small lipoprotein YifL
VQPRPTILTIVRVLASLGLCVVVTMTSAGCSRKAAPVHQPPASEAAPASQDTDQSATAQGAALQTAVTTGHYAGFVMSWAWNGDVIQVGVRSDRSTMRDKLGLCSDLAARFGAGYDVQQILITPHPVGPQKSDDKPLHEGARWNAADHTCRSESV